MVLAVEQEQEQPQQQETKKSSRFFNFKGFGDNKSKHAKSTGSGSANDKLEAEAVNQGDDGTLKPDVSSEELVAALDAREKQVLNDMAQMKEKFAKLLLGEDMSGGGTGVSSALALSNAITNLAASVFGEQSRLEPMSDDRKARWRREMNWLLSVTDHIVELVASHQKNKDGSDMEIMVTKQRKDLIMNIPALRTLDSMLIDGLDTFKGQTEFYYLSKDASDSEKGSNKRKDDKWWLPTVKVPSEGLSEAARKNLQVQKECVTQVLKAAMAINAQLLSEMEIPESYIEALPKNGRASLGDLIYKSITDDSFDPDQFLSSMDFTSEHKILDLKNRIEASIVIWKRKMVQKDAKSWGSGVSMEKREMFEDRVQLILHLIKHRYPGLAQSQLDMSKIEYNKDVGQAVLESYSRILESLAHTVLSRIEDVVQADLLTQNPSTVKSESRPGSIAASPIDDSTKTLSDLLTISTDKNGGEEQTEQPEAELPKENEPRHFQKLNMMINKKMSYLETLGGLRSPTTRH